MRASNKENDLSVVLADSRTRNDIDIRYFELRQDNSCLASKIVNAAEFGARRLVQNLVKMVNCHALTAKNEQDVTRRFNDIRHLHNNHIFC
jgi:hypothetical protein